MKTGAAVLLALLITTESVAADNSSAHSFGLDLRYRLELVDQDGLPDDAVASTLKARFKYTYRFNEKGYVFAEVDSVAHLGADNFNDTRNRDTAHPVVADPDGIHINQLYLALPWQDGELTLGRQRINLDDQRFVGGVGWRQNEQTYDGLRLQQNLSDWQFDLGYIDKVSRIFGPDSGTPADELNSQILLLNLERQFVEHGKLGMFFYDMDFDDAAGLSNRTLGLSYQHRWGDALAIPLKLRFARQEETGDNPVDYRLNYYQVELGLQRKQWSFTLGMEILEGNGVDASFKTPLATLHKFQGWSDKFLATPASGIRDRYASLKVGAALLAYHDYRADASGGDLGSEINLSWNHRFNKRYGLLVKFADYQADNHASDTQKLWLMLTVKI